MPSDVRNMPLEQRAQAIVDFCERVVRDQMPDPDDPTSDYGVMDRCLVLLAADLRVLVRQAGAQWTKEFDAMLRSADSMRCVRIAPDTKDTRRQQPQRCDACGRYERWCGVAIDLGGGDFQPERWWDRGRVVAHRWPSFRDRYLSRVEPLDAPRPTGLRPHDLGRFCLGSTCQRKAKLAFGAATVVPDMLYDAYAVTAGAFNEEEEDATEPLMWATEEQAAKLLDYKEQLELCIADERRQDTPDVMTDATYWQRIDAARAAVDDDAVRERSRASLAGERLLPTSADGLEREADGGGDGEWVVDEDEGEQSDQTAQSESEDAEVLPPKKRKKTAKLARRVVSDGEDDEEDVPTAQAPTTTTTNAARARGASAAPARQATKIPRLPQRRSGRVAGLEPGDEVYIAQVTASPVAVAPVEGFSAVDDADDADDADEDDNGAADEGGAVHSSVVRHAEDLVDVGRARMGSGSRAPASVRTATAMRMPRPDGRAPLLGSRQAVLLEACALQQKLTAEGRDADASVLDAVIMTYRELKTIAERSRGVGLGGR